MADTHTLIPRFMSRLSERLGIPLAVHDGVCALYERDRQQAAVIEMPAHSDSVIFHCRLGVANKGVDNLQRLLALNFDVSSLRGCWLALDQGEVRLCTQRELDTLNEDRFCDLVSGFMAQVKETRVSLGRLLI